MPEKLLSDTQTHATSNSQLVDIIHEVRSYHAGTYGKHTHKHMASQAAEKLLSCSMLEPESCSKNCRDYAQNCTGCQLYQFHLHFTINLASVWPIAPARIQSMLPIESTCARCQGSCSYETFWCHANSALPWNEIGRSKRGTWWPPNKTQNMFQFWLEGKIRKFIFFYRKNK